MAKNLTFAMKHPSFIANSTGHLFEFDPNRVGYTLPVGKVVGFELKAVNYHPFHVHINPFQLTKNGMGDQWEQDWFQSGDWHDTMLVPNGPSKDGNQNGNQRVLMQTDFFTGPTVVHCHILIHEDNGMMVQINFTGVEGTRYPPAYGDAKTCRATPETCTLIDPKCYHSSKKVEHPNIIKASTCPPASPTPSPPSPSPPPSSPPCVDTEVKPKKCKKSKCKNYNAAKLKQCKKTCGLCEPLPPSAPPSPPSPPALPEVDCSDLSDNTKCKIKLTKCKKKPSNSMTKCGKKCKKDRKKNEPLCKKTCCELGFPF